ncbi:MAG: 3-deoxy-8-phosphooctulonate synthase [Synergistales bacterium]|nr:3-deoxy-8-phosphooctulonate synthase [Synergistales bacterium]
MVAPVHVGGLAVGADRLTVIAGPCAFESLEMGLEVARKAKETCRRLGMQYIFKASFDKANRTSVESYRGPGMEQGLAWLAAVREQVGVPVVTDIHEPGQAQAVAECVDLLQIPAFLCRQTDLLLAAGRTGLPVQVKKGQFVSPADMERVAAKVASTGNSGLLLCERGTFFGYNQLVVDFRGLVAMRRFGYPVVFDATHSVQRPGGAGGTSGGDRQYIQALTRGAVAIGVDALFLETHPEPDRARSDGPNMVPLPRLDALLGEVAAVGAVTRRLGFADPRWLEGGGTE